MCLNYCDGVAKSTEPDLDLPTSVHWLTFLYVLKIIKKEQIIKPFIWSVSNESTFNHDKNYRDCYNILLLKIQM